MSKQAYSDGAYEAPSSNVMRPAHYDETDVFGVEDDHQVLVFSNKVTEQD